MLKQTRPLQQPAIPNNPRAHHLVRLLDEPRWIGLVFHRRLEQNGWQCLGLQGQQLPSQAD